MLLNIFKLINEMQALQSKNFDSSLKNIQDGALQSIQSMSKSMAGVLFVSIILYIHYPWPSYGWPDINYIIVLIYTCTMTLDVHVTHKVILSVP